MKYVGLLGKILLSLTFGLGLLIATADDRDLAALDFYRPATFLRLVTTRVRDGQSYLRILRTDYSIPAAHSREPTRHEGAAPPPVK